MASNVWRNRRRGGKRSSRAATVLDTAELCERFSVPAEELEVELQRLGHSYYKDSEGRIWSSLVARK